MNPTNKERDIDQWLESALRQYSQAEPRAGLEGRVLANLQVERNRAAAPSRWWLALGTATAAAVAIAVAVWVWQSSHEMRPRNTAVILTTAQQEDVRESIKTGPVPKISHAAVSTPARQVAKHNPASNPVRGLAVATTPKLEQFPSPQPLSEQEQILMNYVARDPENAALIAQAQAEELERDREEEAAAAAKDTAD